MLFDCGNSVAFLAAFLYTNVTLTVKRRNSNMNETVNQETNAAENTDQAKSTGPDKSFTQAEVNAIVKERLDRERAKYGDIKALQDKAAKYDELEAANKTELEKVTEQKERLEKELSDIKKAAEVQKIREKVAGEYNIPVNLLTAESEEALTQQAQALKEWANPSAYPNVRDGGEVRGSSSRTAKDAFKEWAEMALN